MFGLLTRGVVAIDFRSLLVSILFYNYRNIDMPTIKIDTFLTAAVSCI